MTQDTEASLAMNDVELVGRIVEIRQGVEDGTLPVWTAEEPIEAYLERARALHR